jgi:hypothetical protein
MILSVTALALCSAFATVPASAQSAARSMNDGGFAPASQSGAAQTGIAQYNGAGQVTGTGNEAGSCAQRFHSFDPATGTYLGFDGARHPCQ